MLGRSVGLSNEKLNHLGDDPLPEGVYENSEAAIVRYARKSTLEISIDSETFGALAEHFTIEQMIEIWATVGIANMAHRFHATFYPDVDEETLEAVEAGDRAAGACALRVPSPPTE